MKFEQLLSLFQKTHSELQQRAARSVDIALVVRNWLFGWYIVEFEQAGADRSERYGKQLINKLSEELKSRGIKGVSATGLKQYRAFYTAYKEIGQALPDQSTEIDGQALPVESNLSVLDDPAILQVLSLGLTNRFTLGWTHYVVLLSLSHVEERRFYEIEAQANSWGARELERQVEASLYERLVLSRDQASIKVLSQEALVIEKAEDVIKDPYVLEFLDLEEKSAYSEYDLGANRENGKNSTLS